MSVPSVLTQKAMLCSHVPTRFVKFVSKCGKQGKTTVLFAGALYYRDAVKHLVVALTLIIVLLITDKILQD
jgi:hypothetical protein